MNNESSVKPRHACYCALFVEHPDHNPIKNQNQQTKKFTRILLTNLGCLKGLRSKYMIREKEVATTIWAKTTEKVSLKGLSP